MFAPSTTPFVQTSFIVTIFASLFILNYDHPHFNDFHLGEWVETAQPQVSAFCDETGAKSAKLGLFLEQVGSHETRTKELRCLIEYSPSN